MDIEKQVISLELAKRLKELNCKQESIWWWHIYKTDDFCEKQNNLVKGKPTLCGDNWADDYSAFTVAELGEMLPYNYRTIRKFNTSSEKDDWACYDQAGTGIVETIADTEANARAKMLVYLKEKGLMK